MCYVDIHWIMLLNFCKPDRISGELTRFILPFNLHC